MAGTHWAGEDPVRNQMSKTAQAERQQAARKQDRQEAAAAAGPGKRRI